MNTLRTHVANFRCVGRTEGALHAEIPAFRVRVLLVDHDVVSGVSSLVGEGCKRLYPAGAGEDSTILQEVRIVAWNEVGVDRATQLRRQRQNTDVVIEHVIRHGESTAD